MLNFLLNLQLLMLYLKFTGATQASWPVVVLPLVGYWFMIVGIAIMQTSEQIKREKQIEETLKDLGSWESALKSSKRADSKSPTVIPNEDPDKPN